MTGAPPGQLPLALPLSKRRARGRGSFRVSASNAAALAMIDAWRDWPNRLLVLTGPEGAGKTHLAHVWMEAAGAEKVSAATLAPGDAPALAVAGAVAVEDADRMGEGAETGLFHLMNLARAEGCALLVTGRGAAKDWPLATPDLRSRLVGATAVALEPPDDALLADLLAKHFADRRVGVTPEVVRFLARRMERSAAAAGAIAERLDRAALAEKRAITMPFIKKTLGF